ncbi:unnamed protein product, partial [Laminaria digitata]
MPPLNPASPDDDWRLLTAMNDVAALSASLRAAAEQLTAPGAPFELKDCSVNRITMRCYAHAPSTLPEA